MGTRILCLGDSLTYGYGTHPSQGWTRLAAARTGLTLTNRGVCGDTLAAMAARLPAGLALKPAYCLLIGGTNDIFAGHAPDTGIIMAMVSACRAAGVHPLLGTPTPMDWPNLAPQWAALVDRSRSPRQLTDYVDWLRQYAAQEHLPLADLYAALESVPNFSSLFTDGVHMTAMGNACIADTVCTLFAGLDL